jgi:hypothetical protein
MIYGCVKAERPVIANNHRTAAFLGGWWLAIKPAVPRNPVGRASTVSSAERRLCPPLHRRPQNTDADGVV